MKDHRTLRVWQRSHALSVEDYSLSKYLPKEELFGPTRRLRRSCSSIPANVAKGRGRDSDAELRRFADIAHGSASEAECFLLLAHELGSPDLAAHGKLAGEMAEPKKMLGALARKLKLIAES